MTSQKLRKAREYEECFEKRIGRDDRPAFHMSSRTGWMNDPNGFSCYKGEYHLFYQYHPYDAHWGPMHWGHAVSRDLLHWEYRPAAMAPDRPYDRDGCFSGSAVTLPDGRHMLMYTGVLKEIQEDGSVRDLQTQCLAVGDGTDYEKYAGNPVLGEGSLPEGASRYDFRDPKIWQKEDGTYCCVVGNRAEDGGGQILLFGSPDGFQWKYKKVLASNNNRFGTMWECPDLFELDGKSVLLVSAMDIQEQEYRYHNGNGTVCLIGDYDRETDTFTEQFDQAVDHGMDFYAPQTLLTPDGRRVIIGWMQNLATCGLHSRELPWFGQLSLPRELSVKNGRLYQKPVRELDMLRSGKIEYKNVELSGTVRLPGIQGRTADMELMLYTNGSEGGCQSVAIYFAQDEKHYTVLKYDPRKSLLQLDRQFSGNDEVPKRTCRVNDAGGRLELRIILDRYSVEIFINGGEQVMTAALYTKQEADGISFAADARAVMDITKYELITK